MWSEIRTRTLGAAHHTLKLWPSTFFAPRLHSLSAGSATALLITRYLNCAIGRVVQTGQARSQHKVAHDHGL